MHKVSRSLLLAGVLAFGSLSAACGDKVELPPAVVGVQSVTVTPPSATIQAGSSVQLAVSVVADASTAKTVTWTTSSAAVATVDATGKVTGVGQGTATIIATATADASKAAAAVITVQSIVVQNPSIAINSVTDVNGNAVTLGNVNGQINVTVNTSGGGLIEVFLSSACTTNAIGAGEVAVASQTASSAQPGTVTLSFNTAQVTANAPRFPNGNYCVKARLTSGTAQFVATNTVPLTLNNLNVFNGTLAFVSQTTGPTSAVSSINGLNYNQGQLTATINPIIFTGASPAVFISGSFSRNGEMNGAVPPTGSISFTNVPVTAGVATIVFTDTSATGVNNIWRYTSLSAGDTLYISSATDAAGNPISVGTTPVAITGAKGVRIDNDIPTANGTTFSVVAPNGYIPATYLFASGTVGATPPSDLKGGIPGVGGVTITYYVGAAGSAAFATANSCNITGLLPYANTGNLPNTTTTSADQAKVVVKDALGNQFCADAPSPLPNTFFGVDKIIPEATFTTATVNTFLPASDQTGYNGTNGLLRGWNFTFRDSISGFPQTLNSSPFTGTLKRLTPTSAATPTPTDCVIGTPAATTPFACADVAISTANAPSWNEAAVAGSSFLNGTFQFTNGSNAIGYYTVSVKAIDVAGNVLTPNLTRTAAFDNVLPVVTAAPTSTVATDPFGSTAVTASATDNFNLIGSRANLVYPAVVTFARVTGNVLGAFGQFNTTGTMTATLTQVYRGMQDGSTGAISATQVLPTASVVVTDVGGNASAAVSGPISTSTVATPVFAGLTVSLTSSAANGVAGAPVATTNLTFQIVGLSNNAAFQSQPFPFLDIFKLNSNGEWAYVTTVTAATVFDNTTTGQRTYTYVASAVALNQPPAGSTSFIAVGRTAAGDGVRSPATPAQTNP